MLVSSNAHLPVCLAVGATDSSGGAGLAADLAAIAAAGVAGFAVATAFTRQDRRGVRAVRPAGAASVAAGIEAAAAAGARAWKTGALVDAPTVEAVARAARRLRPATLVCDPVVRATAGGRPLLDRGGVRALVRRLLPLATLATPNAAEATLLSGLPVRTVDEAVEAARAILALGPRAVVVKGGHVEGRAVVDVLAGPGRRLALLREPRLPGSRRGSGCRLASFAAAALAAGDSIEEAVRRARRYVRRTWGRP